MTSKSFDLKTMLPNLTLQEAIKRDLKEWNIPKELCLELWIEVLAKKLFTYPNRDYAFSLLVLSKAFPPPISLSFSFVGDFLLGFNSSLPQLACNVFKSDNLLVRSS
jgi:hypothetical protein